MDYIARAGGGRQISVRLYQSALTKVEYALQSGGTADWRELVRAQLDNVGQPASAGLRWLDSKAHDHRCMAIAVEKHPTNCKLRQEVWQEMTAKSRASFFRVKKEFEAQAGQD